LVSYNASHALATLKDDRVQLFYQERQFMV
jgi:hypothetical protein